MEYTIKTLKEEINKLNINNDNLTVLGISSMNEPNELFNPYILYICIYMIVVFYWFFLSLMKHIYEYIYYIPIYTL